MAEARDRHGQPFGAASAPPAQPPAWYAASSGRWRDWLTVLHPPYTAWHLSYVLIGAAMAPRFHLERLLATLIAIVFALLLLLFCARAAGWTFRHTTPASPPPVAAAR